MVKIVRNVLYDLFYAMNRIQQIEEENGWKKNIVIQMQY
jgi:hypothetical protein